MIIKTTIIAMKQMKYFVTMKVQEILVFRSCQDGHEGKEHKISHIYSIQKKGWLKLPFNKFFMTIIRKANNLTSQLG